MNTRPSVGPDGGFTLVSAQRNDTYKTKADLKVGLYVRNRAFDPAFGFIGAGPRGTAWDPIPAYPESS